MPQGPGVVVDIDPDAEDRERFSYLDPYTRKRLREMHEKEWLELDQTMEMMRQVKTGGKMFKWFFVTLASAIIGIGGAWAVISSLVRSVKGVP